MTETITNKIDKTIIIPFEDCNRMIAFCKDSDGSITKDFFDWYLKAEGEFFIKSGMLIIDNAYNSGELLPISFDFSNPAIAKFISYVYADRSIIAKWEFKRDENISMKEISIHIDYQNMGNWHKLKTVFLTHDGKVRQPNNADPSNYGIDIISKVQSKIDRLGKKGIRQPSHKEIMNEAIKEGFRQAATIYYKASTYLTYALMYYVSKQNPEIVESEFTKYNNEESDKVKGFYKYTGYIDLRDNKIYKPTIKRDPNIPAREYQRHIQAWTVRGHYRKTKNGLTWVEPHIKGSGKVEKRIYGTEDEKDLNLIPQVFEVEKRVKINNIIETKKEQKEGTINEIKPSKQNKIISFIKNIFKRFFTGSNSLPHSDRG